MKKGPGVGSGRSSPSSQTIKHAGEDSSSRILKLALEELKKKTHDADNLKNIREDPSFQIVKLALKELGDRYNLSFDDIKNLVGEKPGLVVPVSIFQNKRLSALEIICKYLREETRLGFSRIASLLNRDPRTVWTTYSKAVRKQKARLAVKESIIMIPVEIFSDRKFSVLETLVSYLKDHHNLSFAQISQLLQKDPRNIWTVYSRFRKKTK